MNMHLQECLWGILYDDNDLKQSCVCVSDLDFVNEFFR
jgi:hypothetical protein